MINSRERKRAYYVVNVNRPGFDTLVETLEGIQAQTFPDNQLSVVFNKVETQALIKVGGIDIGEFADDLITASHELPPVALVNSAAWKPDGAPGS